MTAKEYLLEVQRLKTIVERKQDQIKEFREGASTVRAAQLDREKVQGGRQTDRIGEAISKIVDLQAEVENDIINFLHFQHKVIQQIQELKNPNHITLLYKRYVEGKKIPDNFRRNEFYIPVHKGIARKGT